jgi:hypothetical protein
MPATPVEPSVAAEVMPTRIANVMPTIVTMSVMVGTIKI